MKRAWAWPAVLFAFVFAVYVVSPMATPFDSRFVVHTTLSLIHEGNAELSEYRPLLKENGWYAIECIHSDGSREYPIKGDAPCAGGKIYNFYPVAQPVLMMPFVAGLEFGLKAARPLLEPLIARTPAGVRRSLLEGDLAGGSMPGELVLASALVALSVVLVFLFARELAGLKAALAVALIYAFATPAWSTGSRAMWMHGFSMLMLPAALWMMRRERWAWAGATLMLAFFVRPTNVVGLVCAGAWALWQGREAARRFVLGTLPVLAVFAVVNYATYSTLLAPYFFAKRAATPSLALHHRLGEALLGNLVSPSRGLFVYCPIFLASLYGLRLWMRDRQTQAMGWYVAAVWLMHYLLMSLYEDWFGGHSYGPRYQSDLASLMALALLPAWGAIRGVWRKAFLVALAFSLFVHQQGAWCWPCVDWNSKPVELRYSQHRLWDWSDPAFLRGFSRYSR